MRTVAILLCLVSTVVWSVVVLAVLFSGSDPATRGLDVAAGMGVTLLYGITTVPSALVLFKRGSPRLAMALATAFPLAFVLLFVGAALSLA